MKTKTLCLIFLVVVFPIGFLSWGGYQLAQKQSTEIEGQVKSLLRDQLVELDSRIKRYFLLQEAKLQQITSRQFTTLDSIRDTVDSTGIIDNLFIITRNGTLAYPNPLSALNERELEFYSKIRTIVEDGDIQNQVLKTLNQKNPAQTPSNTLPQNFTASNNYDYAWNYSDPNLEQQAFDEKPGFQNGSQSELNQTQSRELQQQVQNDNDNDSPRIVQKKQENTSRPDSPQKPLKSLVPVETFDTCSGWFVWYWGRGLNLIYWNRVSNGSIVCIALSRPRWMSDLVVELPDSSLSENDHAGVTNTSLTDNDTQGDDSREMNAVRSTRIVNANNEVVYQWGSDSEELVMGATLPASSPLTAWTLQILVPPEELKGRSYTGFNIILGIIASSIALITVAWIFVRDYTKELSEASRRVSFVNQVSHELRTPLTNIRMYAELLEKDIQYLDDDQSAKANDRLQVIESESERLSRLIGNVLSFAGNQKKNINIHLTSGVIDECVESVISSFAPNLEKQNLRIETDLKAGNRVRFDSDMLEQILGNLLGNVEKYANQGKFVKISTEQNRDTTTIRVEDDGAGVPAKFSSKIFQPFWRMSNELQHASGTGIGLSISRELARLHDGDLTLENRSGGACFIIKLKTEKAKS